MYIRNPTKSFFSYMQVCAYLILIPVFSSSVHAEESGDRIVITVVTTPSGTADEASVAASLVPESAQTGYSLVPVPDRGSDGLPDDAAKQAHTTAEKAKQAAVDFDLVKAAQLWRRAADEITDSEVPAVNPSLAAGYLIQAGAASAEAGEKDLAVTYFRRALGVDIEKRTGPTVSPGAQKLFDSALEQGPVQMDIPGDRILRKLCIRLDTRGVVWISAGRSPEGLVVSEKILLLDEDDSSPAVVHEVSDDARSLETWIGNERSRIHSLISLRIHGEDGDGKGEDEWYRQWWFYTALGGVVAATAVGLAVGLTLQPDEIDVVVHH